MLRYFLLLSSYPKFYKLNREESRFSWWSNKYQIVLLHVFWVYMCAVCPRSCCAYVYVGACVSVSAWKGHRLILCVSLLLSTLVFESGSLTEPRTQWSGKADRAESFRYPLVSVSPSQCWGTDTHRRTWLTQGPWRFKLTLLCLHSTHLTIGAIAPEPISPSFKFKDDAFRFSFLYQQ